MQKNIAITVAAVILIVSAAVFITRDFRKATSPNSNQAPSTSVSEENLSNIKVTLDGIEKTGDSGFSVTEQSSLPLPPTPNLDRTLIFKGDFSAEAKDEISARIAELSGLLKKNPDSLSNWLDLGLLRKTIGDYQGAREAWEYANAIRPRNHVSFSNLGDLFHHYLKDYPNAENSLLQSIKNGPNNISAYRALVNLYTESYTDKLSEVPEILLSGLVANPNDYDILVMLASYYKNAGDKTKAVSYYQKAIAIADKAGKTGMNQVLQDEVKNLSQ